MAKPEGLADDHASDHEAALVPDTVVAVVPLEPFPAAAVPPAVAPMSDVFADIAAMSAPDWAVGVEVADINNNTKTKCFLCGLNTMKGVVFFRYWQSTSVQK